jgi:predicted PurR-regulated permease PerM
MSQDTVTKAVVVLMALGISALFLSMISPFLMALFLAGLFSALARPLFLGLTERFGGRRQLASLCTLLIMAVAVIIPLSILAGIMIAQAFAVSHSVSVWVAALIERPEGVYEYLHRLPFYKELGPYRDQIVQQASQVAASASSFLVDALSSLTLGTANLVFTAFVLLYSMYFLQLDGHRLVERFLYYLPLKTADERLLLAKFTSVTRATLRGSLLIGLLQGGLAGIAFAVAGIPNAVFWGTTMAVLSIIPSIGSALIWAPAAVILLVQGRAGAAIALAAFCALVVGSLDNVLRPILVGKDTKMHELMIFFGTMGGIFMFGFPGIFIGPVIASLFVAIWALYGVELAEVLPDVDCVLTDIAEPPPLAASDKPAAAPDARADD